MPTTYSLVGPYLKVARSATDFDLYDLRGNVKISDVAEVVTITQGQTNKKFEIPYASFDPVLSGSGAFMTLFNAQVAKNIASVAWGYDSVTGVSVLIKIGTDGITTYENPIGNPYTPIGNVLPTNEFPVTPIITSYTSNVSGFSNACHSLIVVNQSAVGGIFNGQTFPNVAGYALVLPPVVLGDGSLKMYGSYTHDGSVGALNITEIIY